MKKEALSTYYHNKLPKLENGGKPCPKNHVRVNGKCISIYSDEYRKLYNQGLQPVQTESGVEYYTSRDRIGKNEKGNAVSMMPVTVSKSILPNPPADNARIAARPLLGLTGRSKSKPSAIGQFFQDLKGTYLNPYNWGVPDYSEYKTKDKAYSAAKKAGESEFLWKGTRYTTEYAGTPRQEVGRYGANGRPVNVKDYENLVQTNVYPPLHRNYVPGHISSSFPAIEETVDYGPYGNVNAYIGVPDDGAQAYYSFGVDPNRFRKVSSNLPTDAESSTWNLITNNCADNVCDAFGIPRAGQSSNFAPQGTPPITTPGSAMAQIKRKYPTINVTGRTFNDYADDPLHTAWPDEVLNKADYILGIASSPDLIEQGISKWYIQDIQRALSEVGYSLPKSKLKDYSNRFDGIFGEETKAALEDWKRKNSRREDGGLAKFGPGGSVANGCPPYMAKNSAGQCVPEVLAHLPPTSTNLLRFTDDQMNAQMAAMGRKPVQQTSNYGPTKDYQNEQFRRKQTEIVKKAIAEGKQPGFSDKIRQKNATISQGVKETPQQKKQSSIARYNKNLEYAKATGSQFNYETGDVASPSEKTYGSGWGKAHYPALAQTMASMTPSGNIQAGMIGANALVDMLPGPGQVTAAKRLGEFDYFQPNAGFWGNALGTLGLAGDVLNIAAPLSFVKTPSGLQSSIKNIRHVYNSSSPAIQAEKQAALGAGESWVNEWYSHPETLQRIQNIEGTTSQGLFRHNPNFKGNSPHGFLFDETPTKPIFARTTRDLTGVPSDLKTSLTRSPVMGSYNMGRATINPAATPKQIINATVEELTHARTNAKLSDEMRTLISDAISPVKTNKWLSYLTKPEEVYPRINRLRKEYGLKPGQQVSEELVEQMIKENGRGAVEKDFIKSITDKKALQKAFNRLPGVIGLGVASEKLLQSINREQPQQKEGGLYNSIPQFGPGGEPCPEGFVRVNGKCVEIEIANAAKQAEDYITGWYNSPKYKQRFQESLSPGEEYMVSGRQRRLAAIPNIEWVNSGLANYLAKTNPTAEEDLQIKLNLAAHTPEALQEQSLVQSAAHELDHIVNMGGRYIPKKTRQFISSIRPKSFEETPIYKKEIQPHMKMRKDFFDKILGGSGKWINKEEVNKILRNRNVQENWFSEPPPDNPSPDFYEALNYKFNYYNPAFKNKTETISFWNKIRQDAKELGIYDPYTEDFDKEKFDKFLQIGNTPKTRDFRKLIDWYGNPDIIIEGMNKIVKTGKDNLSTAQDGGVNNCPQGECFDETLGQCVPCDQITQELSPVVIQSSSGNGITYAHRPRGNEEMYMLKRTHIPYISNRDIRRNIQAPVSPRQVNFLSNYAGATGEPTAEGFVYPTQVPFEGAKHWNIDRFIIDPHFGQKYDELKNLETTKEQARANALADMYKYYMLQYPNKKGKAFRKAKRFVRNEIDPRISGPFYDYFINRDFPVNFPGVEGFADANRLEQLYQVNAVPAQADVDRLKDISIDYFRNYKKMSKKEAENYWKEWERGAAQFPAGDYPSGFPPVEKGVAPAGDVQLIKQKNGGLKKYQKGGVYDVDDTQIQDLINQGYKIKFV